MPLSLVAAAADLRELLNLPVFADVVATPFLSSYLPTDIESEAVPPALLYLAGLAELDYYLLVPVA